MAEISITDQLLHSTVRIECELNDGSISTGTGFFFRFLDDGETYIPALVTNKHVVQEAKIGKLVFSGKTKGGLPDFGNKVDAKVEGFESRWIPHPNPDIDLCVMPIGFVIHRFKSQGQDLFFTNIPPNLIQPQEELEKLNAIEDILMIGYPNGIWDEKNNLPVFRKGVTASPVYRDYNGRSVFLVDASVFPGSSGSPVFILNLGGYSDKNGNRIIKNRIIFLGVVYAVFQHTTQGEIVIENIPTKAEPRAITNIPNNLGLVIKAKHILDFEPIIKQKDQNT